MVEQEVTRMNISVLGISDLKWTGMGRFNSDDHVSNPVGKNPLEEMVPQTTKELEMWYLGTISKMAE